MADSADNNDVNKEIRINDVLCYLTTGRNSLSRDNIVVNAVAYYTGEVIFSAKEIIFSFSNERAVKRKVTNEHPNPAVMNVKDILTLLDKMEGKVPIPSFVAANYNSLPPNNFGPLAAVLCSLKDEIAALRNEVCQLREVNAENVSSNIDNACVKQDISDIKLMLQNSLNTGAQNKVQKNLDRSQDGVSYAATARNISSRAEPTRTGNYGRLQEEKIGMTSGRKEHSNPTPIQRNDYSNTQSVRQRYPTQRNNNVEPSVQPVQQTLNVEQSDRNSESWQVVGRSSRQNNRRMLSRRGNREANVSGTGTVSNNLVGVQRMMDIFVGGCDKNSNEDGIKKHCETLGIQLMKVEELTTKSEWYKAYKISMKATDKDKLMLPDSWPQGIFVRRYFKPRTVNNTTEQ